ncbi:sensor domain-containing diguanylate cyclase [Ectopseudomonas alcaliphila]|uniref:sensor domain-containing diguanylate cyclase n=1 Tax=Ectopseudomonas alcaliphila TaxID=101564 RepID=UPI00278476B3|nr:MULTISPECIES: sensor domain-containing diguanylate cyclase [Pseudomonas]MDP9938305.1 diguanylate cyclase (GGDEF)-like protein [Pseudomonas sp. 3400]MDR7010528.1 diguanylate cyclase (GGDEF)-like protein [Pseudomonas alcaliphila]
MLSVPLPANETERQQALDRLELLDTPADPYLDTLTRLAHDLFQVKMALVTLVDRDRQWFKSRQGLDVAETERSLSYCSHVVLHDEPLIVEDSQVDQRFAGTELALNTPDVRFYAGWPLRDADGMPLGTLCVADPLPRQFGHQDRFKLRDLAYLTENYLHLQHCSQQASDLRDALSREQRKGMLDALTQLWNRAGLLHFLPLEQAAAERHQLRLGLIYCDLDHFKQVNDGHGHDGGDHVLWESARRMSSAVRPQDVVTRNGGEEFVILTQVHDEQELLQIAERIRLAIASQPMQLEDAQLQQTASLGCALLGPGESAVNALKRADQALYRAKHSGRNRTEFAPCPH